MTPFDPALQEELLRHHDWLRRLARRLLQDEARAEDAIQQTWLAALRSPPRPDGPLRGWLATVLRNTALRHHRESARRETRERASAVAITADEGSDPVDAVERFELQRRLVEEVAALEEPLRSTVLLRYFEDLPPRDVARRLGVPPRTVETRLYRARRRLRERMDGRHGGSREAWCAPLAPWALSPAGAGGSVLTGWLLVLAGAVVAAGIGLASFGDGDRPDAASPRVGRAPATSAGSSPSLPDEPRRVASVDEANDVAIAKDPVDEFAATPPVDDPPKLLIRVEDDLGTPAQGIRLALVRDGQVLAQGTTNGAGELSFDPLDGPVDCAVFGGSAWPSLHRLDGAAGTRRLVLPGGIPLSGRVLVDGAPPEEPLRVILDVHPAGLTAPALPPNVWTALGTTGFGPDSLTIDTGPDGTFRFSNLPATTNGRLRVYTSGYVREDGSRPHFDVDSPRAGLELRLTALPLVRGRVVLAEGGSGRAKVRWHEWSPEGANRSTLFLTEEAGRFERRLGSRDVARLDLGLRDLHGEDGREFSFEAPFSKLHDLGDLRLTPAKSSRFLVTDPEKRPIGGAVAEPLNGGGASRPSGDDGVVSIAIGPTTERLLVAADGYEPRLVDVAAVAHEGSVVWLERATSLTVRLTGASPTAHASFLASIRSTGLLLPEALVEANGAGALRVPFHVGDFGSAVTLPFQSDGTSQTIALSPHVPFELEVWTALGFVVASHRLVLAPGEAREIEVPVTGLRTVEGTVVDASGRPLANARVTVTHRFESGPTVFTMMDGRFRFDGVLAPTITMLVERPGFAPSRLEEFAVPRDGIDLTVRLEPARTIEVTVVDSAGAPVDGIEMTATDATETVNDLLVPGVDADATRDGRTTIFDLPAGPVVVAFDHAGTRHERLVPPGVGSVTFVVPVPADPGD